ncbi:hypothetical protein CDAR_48941 [Caerostris darwini]|uniref:Uncharacterized protein n=1 Tax=Caerostris darwini TaxID=1538125 RepID=A0AAV4NKQ3_9ARAC|nr:hypothetical protein CDAR_48941 [Caerostris darwini]
MMLDLRNGFSASSAHPVAVAGGFQQNEQHRSFMGEVSCKEMMQLLDTQSTTTSGITFILTYPLHIFPNAVSPIKCHPVNCDRTVINSMSHSTAHLTHPLIKDDSFNPVPHPHLHLTGPTPNPLCLLTDHSSPNADWTLDCSVV